MRFTISTALLSLSSLAFAQNAFNVPSAGFGTLQAGSSVTFSWAPTTPGTVTLVLRSGNSQALAPGTVIESGIPNSGSYTWQIPANLAAGQNYAVEIVDDENPNITNYSPMLAIDSNVSAADASSVTAQLTLATSASPSSAAASTAASASPSSASPSPTSAASSSAARTSSLPSSAPQSTIANHTTGAAFRALPTAFAGAVGAVMGAAAFIL